jgi:Fe-S-cluster containining protein
LSNLHFSCVGCGGCCRDVRIPLSVAEAIDWVNRGHQVQLLCEASPWPPVADEGPKAAHFKRRSFAAMSGSMPVRIAVMLAANLVGACPNLLADRRCGIYADRPLVCRIYPVEINPSVTLSPANKACPPEAWSDGHPLLQSGGNVVDGSTAGAVRSWRESDARDADLKKNACVALNVTQAAPVHEAVLVYSPTRESLLSALEFARSTQPIDGKGAKWRFVSDRSDTVTDLQRSGAAAVDVSTAVGPQFQYLGFARERLFGPYLIEAPLA